MDTSVSRKLCRCPPPGGTAADSPGSLVASRRLEHFPGRRRKGRDQSIGRLGGVITSVSDPDQDLGVCWIRIPNPVPDPGPKKILNVKSPQHIFIFKNVTSFSSVDFFWEIL